MTATIATKPTKVGEVAVYVQVAAYGGWLKSVTVVYWRFLNSPSAWKDFFGPFTMSKDNSALNGCCWVGAFIVFFGALGMARCGGGGSSSPAPSSASSKVTSSHHNDSGSSSRIDSHESYIRASEAERWKWARQKEEELRRKGINNTSARDLKEGLDAFYSR